MSPNDTNHFDIKAYGKGQGNMNMTVAEVKAQSETWRDAGQMHYCRARVFATRDDRTHQITVTGMLGIAPDSHTVILYPITVYRFGHWNKTTVRKQMSEVRRELIAAIKAQGYKLSEPLEMADIRF